MTSTSALLMQAFQKMDRQTRLENIYLAVLNNGMRDVSESSQMPDNFQRYNKDRRIELLWERMKPSDRKSLHSDLMQCIESHANPEKLEQGIQTLLDDWDLKLMVADSEVKSEDSEPSFPAAWETIEGSTKLRMQWNQLSVDQRSQVLSRVDHGKPQTGSYAKSVIASARSTDTKIQAEESSSSSEAQYEIAEVLGVSLKPHNKTTGKVFFHVRNTNGSTVKVPGENVVTKSVLEKLTSELYRVR
jgi:hypothetical protein